MVDGKALVDLRNLNKCDLDGECVEVCPTDVVSITVSRTRQREGSGGHNAAEGRADVDSVRHRSATTRSRGAGYGLRVSIYGQSGWYGLAHSTTDAYADGIAFNNDLTTTGAGDADPTRISMGSSAPTPAGTTMSLSCNPSFQSRLHSGCWGLAPGALGPTPRQVIEPGLAAHFQRLATHSLMRAVWCVARTRCTYSVNCPSGSNPRMSGSRMATSEAPRRRQ